MELEVYKTKSREEKNQFGDSELKSRETEPW